jgi:alkanesulfonate monooxygenase SsuD/methylene tetrahydromethanopterin reductase-like flavin-dependent oxidoreductase (luciferase family)
MPTTNAVVSPGEAPLTTGALAPGGDLSIFLATPATANPYQTYVDAFESIELAEALGYSYAWIAEAHFSSNFGIPTALPFLAAVTQRVSRIALGTAVIPLAFDVPLRIAESAALVNVLTHDRLELGVGKGNPRGSTDAYNAFGLNEGDRNALFAKSIEALKDALRGELDLGDHRVRLYPPAVTLLDRIWQATGDHATANAAGAAGDGLMLFRTTPDGVAGDVQSLVIDSYLRNFDHARFEPRIGVSRSLLLADSRADAVQIAVNHYASSVEDSPFKPESLDPGSVEGHLRKFDVYFGTVDDVVEGLNNDNAVNRSTNYLFNTPFYPSGTPQFRESLAVIATEVYPRVRRVPDALRVRSEAEAPGADRA